MGVQRRGGRPGRRRPTRVPVVCGVGHEVGRHAGRLRRRRPGADPVRRGRDRRARTGPSSSPRVRGAGRRLDGAAAARLRTAAREVVAERRALDRLSPAAQLASARERVGLLLDRATRAIGTDLAARRRLADGSAGAWRRPCPAGSDAIAASRALGRARFARRAPRRRPPARRSARPARPSRVLGPQATLDRGYAIVRRAGDGAIVRDPAEAPAGTRCASRRTRRAARDGRRRADAGDAWPI